MGILKGPNPIHELADLLARGAQWMSNCQDSNGFYSSSRATPVAIEAMIEYARSFDGLQSPDAKIAVTVGGNVVAEFTVNESNEMLVQSKNLPGVHGIYRISFQGKGRPTFQINHEFYTEITKQESPLALTVVTRAPSCAEEIIRTFNSTICTSYNGNQSQSGPLVVTARSPTGFYIAQGPVYKALSTDKVCDVKFADPITYFYLPPLKRGEKRCFSFTSYLQQRASRIQNSTVTVHDSDNPGNAAYAEYRYPCPKVSEE
ncbi:murinoglobulin-2-like [Leptodactylus fuscus]|uniref:murinoglobulin-2-like n=1 Tax=Leptodactylus fuscus TaxID=238119 RepID=UPI003F4EA373